MRALVISGGGSKGAYAGGIAEYLICEAGKRYDIFIGTSTGSLLIPFLASDEIQRARRAYSNVCQTDIFDKIAQNHPYVIVTVANLSRNLVEYKYARDYTYEDFCDWIWISTNMVPFMSLVQKNGDDYADGGFGNLVPIQEAINMGAKELDVIILSPRHITSCYPGSTNAFNLLVRGFGFMLHQIGQDDIKMSLLESRYSGIKINLIHTPRMLTDNSFIFDPEPMRAWWKQGYSYARTIYEDALMKN